MVILEYTGLLSHHPLEGFAGHGLYRDGIFVLGSLFVFCVTLFLVVYMTTSIAQQVRDQQEELELANRQLQEKDKLKNEYVLRVSHDVKGHLAAIQSCIDTVYDGLLGPLNHAQKDMIGRAHRRTAQALAFVTDLLKLTHMKMAGKVEISCFPIRQVVAKAIGAVKDRAEAKSVSLTAEISASLDIICGEQLLIEETLENLLFNAVKYTPEGGKVRLEVLDQGKQVVIHVRDTGIGIPWDEMPRIFEEFYRASNARTVDREGTGLGLSFAKQVVERHGGQITVQNNQAGGCTFTIILPKGSDRSIAQKTVL
jgi:signal transduction histidine kinase